MSHEEITYTKKDSVSLPVAEIFRLAGVGVNQVLVLILTDERGNEVKRNKYLRTGTQTYSKFVG